MLSARGAATPRQSPNVLTPRLGSSLKLAGADLTKSMRKGVDTAPHLMTGGKRGECPAWSCEPDIIVPTPRTPEGRAEIMQRHKRRTEAGEITVHWGLKGTPRPDPGDGYGVRSSRGENVEDNFRSGQKVGIAEYVNMRGESIYYSTTREPLGASYSRCHQLPDETKQQSFPGFGKALVRDDYDAKDTIFPRNVEPEKPEDSERYKQTHQNWEPGETASRKYVWPDKIVGDPHFRFGIRDQEGGSLQAGKGVKNVLNNATDEGTRIVKQTSEVYRQVANDQLGTSRNMMQGEPPLPAGHAYGVKSSADQISASELVRGFYSVPEQGPDHDLGRCVMPGRRNFATRRPFGVPSVRTDVVAPAIEKRSVANSTNYGDDQGAFTLIYPSRFGCRGVSETDFKIRRPKQDISALLQGAGYQLPDELFEEIWNVAVQAFGDGRPLVSLEAYTAFLTDRMSSGGQTQRSLGGGTTHRSVGDSADMTLVSARTQAVEPEPATAVA
mmetsp:Transcript_154884/g.288863  ORF Transcript_154884/g.288863 Transcript_154884/m.288863 type:complete len:498 (-) Transcript_154884:58-1551(-)